MPDLSPYLAPAIALLAAAVAWAQWHTARSKLALDLFIQRMDVRNGLISVIGSVMRNGTATTQDVIEFSGPQDKARFLFGDDVNAYLQEIHKTLANLGLCRSILSLNKGDEEYQRMVELEARSMRRVATFYDDLGKLLEPYMRMDHKKPMWWLRRG